MCRLFALFLHCPDMQHAISRFSIYASLLASFLSERERGPDCHGNAAAVVPYDLGLSFGPRSRNVEQSTTFRNTTRSDTWRLDESVDMSVFVCRADCLLD